MAYIELKEVYTKYVAEVERLGKEYTANNPFVMAFIKANRALTNSTMFPCDKDVKYCALVLDPLTTSEALQGSIKFRLDILMEYVHILQCAKVEMKDFEEALAIQYLPTGRVIGSWQFRSRLIRNDFKYPMKVLSILFEKYPVIEKIVTQLDNIVMMPSSKNQDTS